MKIYVYGCTTCGVNSVFIRRIRKIYDDVQVINTKYDEQARQEHVNYLQSLGLALDSMKPIIVDGDTVKELRKWRR